MNYNLSLKYKNLCMKILLKRTRKHIVITEKTNYVCCVSVCESLTG